jgi:hypothetical protein
MRVRREDGLGPLGRTRFSEVCSFFGAQTRRNACLYIYFSIIMHLIVLNSSWEYVDGLRDYSKVEFDEILAKS